MTSNSRCYQPPRVMAWASSPGRRSTAECSAAFCASRARAAQSATRRSNGSPSCDPRSNVTSVLRRTRRTSSRRRTRVALGATGRHGADHRTPNDPAVGRQPARPHDHAGRSRPQTTGRHLARTRRHRPRGVRLVTGGTRALATARRLRVPRPRRRQVPTAQSNVASSGPPLKANHHDAVGTHR